MRSIQPWCTQQQTEGLDLSELTILDESIASLSRTREYTSSVSQEPDTAATALGYYMDKLPPEVLSEIFSWCTPTADDQTSCNPQAALILSHVCRHWRAITCSSPQLWTYTKIRILQEALYPALDLMALYLKRSKSLPVFIDVDFVDVYSYYRPALDLFEQIVHKVRELRSTEELADSFLATHLEASSTEDRPTREEWYFWSGRPLLPPSSGASNSSHGADRQDRQLTITPSRKPSETLVTIRALRVAIGSFVLEPYLPWSSSLTFLVLKDLHDFTNLSVAEAARILSCFSLLVHCSLHIDFESVDVPLLETNSVKLEFLKSFSLSWADWLDVGPLLDSLSVPLLHELELVGRLPDTAVGGEWGHLVHFLRRNNPPISHVILEQIDCFHVSFLSSLSLTPALEGLWLEDCLLDDSIIRGLEPVLGSSLKTLVILDCYAFDMGVLLRILRDTRRQRGSKVMVYIDGNADITPAHMAYIREEGLDNVEVGPSSMPSDNSDAALESTLEFVDAL